MAKRRERFSHEEHMVAGQLIRHMRDDASLLWLSLYDAYGTAMSSKAKKIAILIDELRCQLDGVVCGEYPMSVHEVDGTRLVNVYYAPRADVPQEHMPGSAEGAREILRQKAGLAPAAPAERKAGRPRTIDTERLEEARERVAQGVSVDAVARDMNLATSTLYRYMKKERERA